MVCKFNKLNIFTQFTVGCLSPTVWSRYLSEKLSLRRALDDDWPPREETVNYSLINVKLHGLLWQIINSQEPVAGTLECSHPLTFYRTKKFLFHFTGKQQRGLVQFCFAWQSSRPPSTAKVTSSCYTSRVRETFFFLWLVFVEWEEILKHCAMVPQKFWKVVRAFLTVNRLRVELLEKRSPCCIHTEWRATSSLP